MADIFELGFKVDSTPLNTAKKHMDALAESAAKVFRAMKDLDFAKELTKQFTQQNGEANPAPIDRRTKALERYAKMTNTVAGALQYQKQAMDAINASMKSATNAEGLYDIAVTNVNTKVESAINAINRKSEAFKQEQIAQKQAIAEANKYNAVMEKSQILASKTNLRVSFKEYAEKIALEKQVIAEANKAERAEASLERKRNSLASTTASLEGVTFRYNQRMKEINEIFPESIRDTDRYRAAVANADAEYQNSINRINAYSKVQEIAGTKTRLARHEMLNLSYQLQDIVVGFVSGQRPMTVFIQQGAQIAGIAGAAGLGLKGMAEAMWDVVKGAGVAFLRFLSNPYALVFVATITALTVAYKALNNVLNSESGLSKAQSDFVKLGGTVDDFKRKLDELGGSTVTFSDKTNALVGKSISDLFSDMGSAFSSFSKKSIEGLIGTGAYLLSLRKSFTWFTEVKDPFGKALKDGQKAIKETQDLFDNMKKDMETPLQIRIRIATSELKDKHQLTAVTDLKAIQRSLLTPLEQIKATATDSIIALEKVRAENKKGFGYISEETLASVQKRILAKEKADTDAYYADLAKKRKKDSDTAINEAKRAEEAVASSYAMLSKYTWGTGFSQIGAEIEKAKAQLNSFLAKGYVTKALYTQIISAMQKYKSIEQPKEDLKSADAMANELDFLHQYKITYDQQIESFKYYGKEYENIIAYQQQYNQLRSQGIDLNAPENAGQKKILEQDIATLNEQNQVHSKGVAIYTELKGAEEQAMLSLTALDDLFYAGKITDAQYYAQLAKIETEYDKTIDPLKNLTDETNINTQAIASGNQRLEDEIALLQMKKQIAESGQVSTLSDEDIKRAIENNRITNQTVETYKELYSATNDLADAEQKLAIIRDAYAKKKIDYNTFIVGARQAEGAITDLRLAMGKGTWTDSIRSIVAKFGGGFTNVLDGLTKAFSDFFNSMRDGFADSIGDAIVYGKSLKDSFADITKSILKDMISALVKLALQYVVVGNATATAGVANQALGDPYTAFARMAAMATVMAGLGFAVNSFGGNSSKTPATSKGTGTVLGDTEAQSESISNALERIQDATEAIVGINTRMFFAISNLSEAITGVVTVIARNLETPSVSGYDSSFAGQNLSGVAIGGVTGAMLGGAFTVSLMSGMEMALSTFDSTLLFGSIMGGLLGVGFGDKLSSGFGDALNSVMSSIVGTLVDIPLVGGAVSSIIGGGKKLTDYGIKLNGALFSELINGVNASLYTVVHTSGGWFSSGKNKTTLSALPDEVANQLGMIFGDMADAIIASTSILGFSAEEVQKQLDAFTVSETISLKGLSASEQQDTLNAVFSKIFDDLATAVAGDFLATFQQTGEGMSDTLTRVATDVLSMTYALNRVDKAINGTSSEIAQMSVWLVDAAGSISDFLDLQNSFIEKFYSDSEQFIILQNDLTNALSNLDEVLPSNRQMWQELVNGIDISTQAGVEQYITLMKLTDAADQYYSHLEDIETKRTQLQIDLLNAVGLTTEATTLQRQVELDAMDESLRALQQQVWAVEDATQATADATQAAQDAAQAAQDLAEAQEVLIQLEYKRQAMEATLYEKLGQTSKQLAITRKAELDQMEATLRPLQGLLYLLEDAQTASDAAMTALQASVDAQKTILETQYNTMKDQLTASLATANDALSSWTNITDTLTSTLNTLANSMDSTAASTRKRAQAELQSYISTASGGGMLDSDALSNTLSVLTSDSKALFSTYSEYAIDYWTTAQNIKKLKDVTGEQKDAAQLAVDALNVQIDQNDLWYNTEIAKLDNLITQYQTQIDALRGVDNSVKSVTLAVNNVIAAINHERATSSATSTVLSTTDTSSLTGVNTLATTQTNLESLYQSILGRAPDLGGLSFYTAALSTGEKTLAQIANEMLNSPEYLDGSHANGLSYVPFDGYRAELHKGEAVLTKQENQTYQSSASSSNKEMVDELKNLRQEMEQMRKTQQRWDIDGMPTVRNYA